MAVPLWDDLSLPDAVDLIILPFGMDVTLPVRREMGPRESAGDGERQVRLL
jgi:hypothetical protein